MPPFAGRHTASLMDDSRKARLIENTGLYIDSHELIKRIYKLLYEMPKKDRVVMGDSIMRLSLDIIAHLRSAYRFKETRVRDIDKFLFCFDKLKELLRICCELKIIKQKSFSFLFEYVARIDEGIAKWRKSSISRKVQANADSNDDRVSGND